MLLLKRTTLRNSLTIFVFNNIIMKKSEAISTKSAKTSVNDILLHQAFNNSLQPNIVSIAGNGIIVTVNKAACKLFGYSKKELETKSRSAIFDIKESGFKKMLKQQTTEGHSIALVTGIKKNGKRIPCEITSAVFLDENGNKKAITTVVDRSQSILEQKNIDSDKEKIVANNIVLAELKHKKSDKIKDAKLINIEEEKKTFIAECAAGFKMAFVSSTDILYDIDLLTNLVTVSDGYVLELGYTLPGNTLFIKDFFSHIHSKEKKVIENDFEKMLITKDIEWKYSCRYLKADGAVADFILSGIVLRTPSFDAYRIIGFMHNASEEKVLEEKLKSAIELKEKQIAEAVGDARDAERSNLGKELHDNVNQLLVASKLYLEMAKRGGNNSEMYLSRSSEYTLNAITEIRKLSRSLAGGQVTEIGLRDSIQHICHDSMEISPVNIECDFKKIVEEEMEEKFKLTLFRIIQEHLNNILQYAEAQRVFIMLSQNRTSLVLTISDNGIGYDTNKLQKGIGITNIKSRAISYNGVANFVSQPGNGCVLKVTFPVDSIREKNRQLSKAT